MRWGWVDHSPTPDAEPPPKPHLNPQPPTPAEAARILTAAWADPDLGLLVWLAMVTGARRGELCALRWRHLEPTRQVLVLEASIAQDGAEVWEKDTKLHQRRHICLDPDTMALLMAYHQTRQRRAATLAPASPPDAFLFSPAADGKSCSKPDAPDSVAPIDAVIAALQAAGAVLQERRDYCRQRQAVIDANAELRERELIKLASLAAALVGAASQTWPPRRESPSSKSRSSAGSTKPTRKDVPHLIRESLDELKAMTAGK